MSKKIALYAILAVLPTLFVPTNSYAADPVLLGTIDLEGLRGPQGPQGPQGEPGTGIEYQGDVQTCTELHTHDGAQKGYAWFNKQDDLLYISTGTGFPTCPGGGVAFRGADGCSVTTTTENKVVNSKVVGKTVTFKNTCNNNVIETFDILNGENGQDGDDGCGVTTTTANKVVGNKTIGKTVTVKNACNNNVIETFDILNGENGQDGQDGQNGQDGCGVTTTTTNKVVNSKVVGKTVTVKNTCNNNVVETFDILNGENGQDGTNGCGVTTTTANKVEGNKTIGKTVTVKNACNDAVIETFDILNGENGQDGQNGQDGCGVTTTTANKVVNSKVVGKTVTVKNTCNNNVVETFDILNGENGQDGTNGCGVTTTTANKVEGNKTIGKTVTVKNACNDAVIETFDILNGQDGQNGQNGQDGCGVTTTTANKVVNSKVVGKTVTVKNTCNNNVVETFDILNGEDGEDFDACNGSTSASDVKSSSTSYSIGSKVSGKNYYAAAGKVIESRTMCDNNAGTSFETPDTCVEVARGNSGCPSSSVYKQCKPANGGAAYYVCESGTSILDIASAAEATADTVSGKMTSAESAISTLQSDMSNKVNSSELNNYVKTSGSGSNSIEKILESNNVITTSNLSQNNIVTTTGLNSTLSGYVQTGRVKDQLESEMSGQKLVTTSSSESTIEGAVAGIFTAIANATATTSGGKTTYSYNGQDVTGLVTAFSGAKNAADTRN